MGSKGTEGSPLKFEFFDEMNEYFRGRPNIVPSDDNPNSMKSNLDSDDDIPIEDARKKRRKLSSKQSVQMECLATIKSIDNTLKSFVEAYKEKNK